MDDCDYCWYFDHNNKIVEDGETSEEVKFGVFLTLKKHEQSVTILGFQMFPTTRLHRLSQPLM
ncbi:hypothetical protein Pan97_33720 [Bremerella volcania]|uniref:Uncharacterized protein n=1 Tax=Bremerella volcania TaxID=2527984 RepID=A0A518CAX1_9BACT|nr:hypothetical protein Pan97_33720 [Bremerella volcania]